MRTLMKLSFILVLFSTISNQLKAQQNILLNQSSYNLYILNPAALGLNKEINVNSHYKKNWLGLSESPELIQFTLDASLSKDKIGLGLNIINENTGIFTKTHLSGAFRYKIKLSKDHHLLFGLSAGFQKQQSDFSKIKADSPEEFAQWPQQQAVTSPDAAFGLIYNCKKLLITASASQLLKQDYIYKEPVFNKEVRYQTIPYFIFSFQNTFNLKSNLWKFTPQLTLRTPLGLPIQFDLVNTFIYKESLLMGVGYRHSFATYANIGYSISEKLRVIYSYEFSLGIQNIAKGGHEIGIHFGLFNSHKNSNNVSSNLSENKPDEMFEKLDQHDQQIESLNKKVDSLDKNLSILKSQLNLLKSQQLNQEEIKKTIENNINKNKVAEAEIKTNNSAQKKESNSIDSPGKYKVISPKTEDEYENSKDISQSNYKIVLGVYQVANYAKEYQKFLKREIQSETQLIQLYDHPKKYIYVCVVNEYTSLNEALLNLKLVRDQIKKQSLELTKGEAWILQTIIN